MRNRKQKLTVRPRQGQHQVRIRLNPSLLSEVKRDIPHVSLHLPKGKSELVVVLVGNSKMMMK
jgi:hypothetical protein